MKRIHVLLVTCLASAAMASAALGFGFSDEARLPHKGVLGRPFVYELTSHDGSIPYTYRIDSGSPPPGLTMSSNGLIAGIPTKAGTFHFWAETIDGYHNPAKSQRLITITIEEPSAAEPAPAPKPGDTSHTWPKPGWNLTFHEEFHGTELDLKHFIPRFDNHPEMPNLCVVKDGVMHLRMDRHAPAAPPKRPDGQDWQGGHGGRVSALETRAANNAFAQKYGWFEIRARLPQGSGLCAGFILLPLDRKYEKTTANGGTRASADEPTAIDGFEFLGKDPKANNFTVHFGKDETDQARQTRHRIFPTSLADDFHVYAVEWNADGLIWYVDGQEMHRSDKSPQSRFFICLALFEGGTIWRGPIDQASYPKDFEIDYVRVYSKQETQP